MKSHIVTSLLLSGLLATACSKSAPHGAIAPVTAAGGIIGGVNVEPADPIAASTALLYLNNRSGVCTVSVLNSEWVLTAGHCADGMDVSQMEVVFDVKPGNDGSTVDRSMFRKVVEARVNPRYADTNKALQALIEKAKAEGRELTTDDIDQVKDWGDISLLHLDRPIPESVRPAKILPVGTKFEKGETVTLSGYGISASMGGFGIGAGVLRKVDVQVEEPIWGTTEILFNQQGGKGACHGDSGGPAFVTVDGQQYLFGVTSRGVHDATDSCGQAAAYTNIDNYRDWLKEVIAL